MNPTSYILIIDDEEIVRELLRRVLTEAGYQVTLASNGVEAIRQLGQVPVGLIISDLNMPGMDGLELSRRIQKLKIPTIIFTGFGTKENALTAMRQGVSSFYLKSSFNIDDFLRRVGELMQSPEKNSGRETLGQNAPPDS